MSHVRTPRRRTAACVGLLVLACLAAPARGHSAHDDTDGATVFDLPVRVSPELGSARGSSVVVDRFGNVFVAADKDTSGAVVAVNTRSTPPVRSRSWAWTSADGGSTWSDLATLDPVQAGQLAPGLSTDLALDGRNRLYVADAGGADTLVTRYHPDARGRVPVTMVSVMLSRLTDLQVRVAGHGDGRVYAVVHASRSPVSSAPRVHVSTDAGANWDSVGVELPGAARCRPVADPASTYVYVTCSDGAGSLLAFTSKDGGRTFTRSVLGKHLAGDATSPAPIPAVVGGTVFALHADPQSVEAGVATSTRLKLYTSRDRGRTWSGRDITVDRGRYAGAGFAVSRRGRLGIGAYWQPAPGKPWQVVGGIHTPGRRAYLTKFGHDLPVVSPSEAVDADRVGVTFTADDRMYMTFTLADQRVEDVPEQPSKQVWFVRSIR